MGKRNHEEIRRAVITACDALLFKAFPALDRQQEADGFILKSVLNTLVWKYTEITGRGGKYLGCEWWSEEALGEYKKDRRALSRKVHLEHVVPRRVAIAKLMAARDPEEVRDIFDNLETCVVLREQHRAVSTPDDWKPDNTQPGGWWQRYEGKFKRVKGPKFAEEDS